MSEQTTPRFRVALLQEIEKWQHEGIVVPELANTLCARYPVINQNSKLITILLVLGAVLTGLGALLFVGANWTSMTRFFKVGILLTAIISIYGAAWYCKFEPGERPKLGSAFLLLGSLFYGASIWLISQIFNFDTSLSGGLILWLIGTTLIALVTKSRAVTFLTALLVPAWNISQNIHQFDCGNPIGSIFIFIPSMASAALLCAHVRSRAALYALLLGGMTWSAFLLGAHWSGLVVYGALLFTIYLCLRDKWETMAGPFLYVGSANALIGCLASTFDKTDIHTLNTTGICGLLLMTVICAAYVGCQRKVHQLELVGCLAIALASVVIPMCSADLARLAMCNSLFVLLMAALLAAGMRLQKAPLINMSITFIVIDIFVRYFDWFFSTLDRSLFFLVGGILFMIAGSIVERNRRRLLGSIG